MYPQKLENYPYINVNVGRILYCAEKNLIRCIGPRPDVYLTILGVVWEFIHLNIFFSFFFLFIPAYCRDW